MKKVFYFLFALLVSTSLMAQKSPRKQAEGEIAKVTIKIDYGSPFVKGREIWGDLEPYGKVWRAGANENTTIEFSDDVKIKGNALPAGKYGFFIIPQEDDDWIVIFNKKNDGWGAYSYDAKDDALRVNIKPKFVDESMESLTYRVERAGIAFGWADARLMIPVSK